MSYRDDDDLYERAMQAGIPIEDLLEDCEVCGELIYRQTCDCTFACKFPPRGRRDPWDDARRDDR